MSTMEIIHGIKKLKIDKPTVATIGVFDGIHRGHRKILKLLNERAKDINAKSCVLTFDPHPSRILHPYKTPPMLISTRHKLNLLAAEGVNVTVLVNFTRHFADISPSNFVEEVLVKRMNTTELFVGQNFLFGKNKSGTIKSLKQLGRKFNFKIHMVPPFKVGGRIISSTLIRKLIMSGKLNEAKRLIGRDISILGTVTKGAKRGRILGFPTANLDLHHEAIPPSGVYIVKVKLADKIYRGILNIGFRPTFKEEKIQKEPIIEVHIFNFNKSIYGKDIEIIFLKRIRNERKFRDGEHLLLRIKKDIDIAGKYFSGRGYVA
jgi:riboflavin kinase/FMN adenylyltransferase